MATRLPRVEERRWLLSDPKQASSLNLSEADKDDEIKKLENELSDQFQEAYKLRREHAVREQQLADATQRAAREAAKAKKTKVSLQKELDAAEDHIGGLQNELQDVKLKYRIERVSLLRDCQSYQAAISVLGIELDDKDDALAGAKAQVAFSRNELSATQDESQCELANLEDALQAAEAETAILEFVLADAQAEKTALAKKLSLAQQQLTAAQAELAAAQNEEANTARMRIEELSNLQAESASRMHALAKARFDLAQANVHHANQAACLRRAKSDLQTVKAEKAGLLEELAAAREREENTVARLREEREESIAAELREIDGAIREGLEAEDSAMLDELEAIAVPQEHLALVQAYRREEMLALEEVLASFDEALALGARPNQPASKQDATAQADVDHENGSARPAYASEGQANNNNNEKSDTISLPMGAAKNKAGKKKRRKLTANYSACHSAQAREEVLSVDDEIPCPDTEAPHKNPSPDTEDPQKQAAGNSADVEAQSNQARKSQEDQAAPYSDPNEPDLSLNIPFSEDADLAAYLLRAEDHMTTMYKEMDAQGMEASATLVQDIIIQAFVAAQEKADDAAVMPEEICAHLAFGQRNGRTTLSVCKDKHQQACYNCSNKQCLQVSQAEGKSETSNYESHTASQAALAEPEGRKALRNRITSLEKDRARIAQKLQATEAERDTLARKLKEAEQNASKSQTLWTKEKRRLQNKLAEASANAVSS